MVDVLEFVFPPPVGGLSISIGVLIIRVFVGILFIVHGAPKIMGPFRKPMRDGMRQIGIPGTLFDLVGLLEFLGGIALIIGFLTRIASALLAIEMLSTTILYITSTALKSLPRGFAEPMFKATKGYMFGWELDTVLLASCAALAIIGSGVFSIDSFVYQLLRS
ncbi:MAG TPA: DoxX family protein [Sulfolobales archaeon]|nr:DoxX family protein [Sulfolobales archaeon]